ncbi:Elongated TPR repeat-containing domain [Penicillium roqueforti FM164]|uniref:Elongated TPR repeat-containing domain n=1 Tax=Penicillium roqueforti (strain FM164) TaxID=1365484 RepID=W6QMS6_PENRF|nr:Elongated TPR repeat-containing domain [Penicillium roqueforti FM164]
MSRVEELPDDFDESLNLNKAPPEVTQGVPVPGFDAFAANETPFPINEEALKARNTDPNAPELPPAIAAIQSHSSEELMAMMNKTPLFMTDIDKAGDEKGENVLLDALQALQNEGTRGEVANSFKGQGNEAVQGLKWIDAKEFYTKALAVINAKENKWEAPEDFEEEAALLRKLEEASYINRALCNLELGMKLPFLYPRLRFHPQVKPQKLAEAEDSAARGLAIDPESKALLESAKKIAERKALLERAAARKKAEEERVRKQNMVLSAALRARQIRTRKTAQPPDIEDAGIRLVPDPLSPESTIEFPVVFLYPMDAQSDFVKAFSEMNAIEDHLSYIFPLPWDKKKEYTVEGVECFMQTVSGGLIKAGKKLPLLQILSGGKVEVVDELVTIHVVPISKTGKYIAEMKARKTG